MHREQAKAGEALGAEVIPGVERGVFEAGKVIGRYGVVCTRPKKGDVDEWKSLIAEAGLLHAIGKHVEAEMKEMAAAALATEVQWEDEFDNVVTTVGKNFLLDALRAATNLTGPYMGLISSVSYSAVAAADTMASHAGWTEAGNTNAPTYSGTRKTAAWNAASGGAISLSAALSYGITGTGTVKGAFLVCGSGASATIENTGGVLYSAGLFSGGDKAVVNTDTLNVSYTSTLT